MSASETVGAPHSKLAKAEQEFDKTVDQAKHEIAATEHAAYKAHAKAKLDAAFPDPVPPTP